MRVAWSERRVLSASTPVSGLTITVSAVAELSRGAATADFLTSSSCGSLAGASAMRCVAAQGRASPGGRAQPAQASALAQAIGLQGPIDRRSPPLANRRLSGDASPTASICLWWERHMVSDRTPCGQRGPTWKLGVSSRLEAHSMPLEYRIQPLPCQGKGSPVRARSPAPAADTNTKSPPLSPDSAPGFSPKVAV